MQTGVQGSYAGRYIPRYDVNNRVSIRVVTLQQTKESYISIPLMAPTYVRTFSYIM